MPVTIRPSPHKVGVNKDAAATSGMSLLRACVPLPQPWSTSGFSVMHSSFKDIDQATGPKLIPSSEGIFGGIVRAYQQDLHLVLRPDDVWLAITTQFSFYVGGHAEALRKQLVAHEGKVELVLDNAAPSPESLDVANMARSITYMMEQHLVDKEIRDWVIPDFTTTTHHDIAVASMTMMATMQKYFAYRVNTGCGFPSVTLLGEREDWVKMRHRLDQLHKYGDEPTAWAALLVPIFDRFVATFDRPDDEELKVFWESVCHAERHGSGVPRTFSGWMTAFASWLVDGRRNRDVKMEKPQLSLDGRVYPRILRVSVPQGVAQVPVVVRDTERFIDFHTQLIAGTVGMSVVDEDESATTVQPRSGWWMLCTRQEKFVPKLAAE